MSDWRQFLAAMAVLAALAALTLGITAQSKPAPQIATIDVPARDILERITFGGKLDDVDYAAIRRLVAMNHRLSENIRIIEILAPGTIEIHTGPENPKPLSGGGDIIKLERRSGDWFVIEQSVWIG